jgi:hypothetical protein
MTARGTSRARLMATNKKQSMYATSLSRSPKILPRRNAKRSRNTSSPGTSKP